MGPALLLFGVVVIVVPRLSSSSSISRKLSCSLSPKDLAKPRTQTAPGTDDSCVDLSMGGVAAASKKLLVVEASDDGTPPLLSSELSVDLPTAGGGIRYGGISEGSI